eukprot:TRINITY_DN31876_c0_g1_i1.p3 TRINITY_DN31876_c0_g1~~TRINITY_DN31876_c0_g1_i1.p3  ORF type:complete len:115 (-),score=1.60 TRINITY_DN31876_c0_g1_i1:1000-1344(-)
MGEEKTKEREREKDAGYTCPHHPRPALGMTGMRPCLASPVHPASKSEHELSSCSESCRGQQNEPVATEAGRAGEGVWQRRSWAMWLAHCAPQVHAQRVQHCGTPALRSCSLFSA